MAGTDLFAWLFSGIWCLVGGIFLIIGIGMRRSWQRREERLRARATGTVVELVRRTGHDSDGGTTTSWAPIVEFTCDGRKITLEAADSGGRKRHWEGQSVEVLYDPDDPASFRLEGDAPGRLLGNIMLAVGVGCLAVGVIVGLGIRLFGAALPVNYRQMR